MVCFVWGALLYFRIYNPPTNAMNIYIVGKQWMWKAEHPGGQHEIDALHVPIGRPVQLTMISQDVFHSFSIPAFRVKREVIPGRYSTVWFQATTPGTYHIFCTQYCGTLHSQMIGWVTAMRPEDYQAWTAGSTSGASLSPRTASGSTPAWDAMPATPARQTPAARTLPKSMAQGCSSSNGGSVMVDDAFLRDTILNPSMHTTAGYAPIMPTYQGQVSEEGLIDLVEYIKRLNSNYRIQQTLNTTQVSPAQTGGQTSTSAAPSPASAPGMVKR